MSGVVIPAYNASAYIAAAVASVLAQSTDCWQLVVIDDGSTDDTVTIAETVAAGDSRIRVVSQPNAGRSHARNHGERLLADSVDYVLFLDADDLLEPNALERLSAYLDNHAEVACVGCQFTPIDVSGDEIPAKTLRREKAYRTRWVPGPFGLTRELRSDEFYTPFVTFYTGSGVGPHALYRRAVFQAVGGYDTRFDGREDHDLFMRVSLGETIHYLPDRLYQYRLHPEQSTKNHEKFQTEARLIKEKWSHFATEPEHRRVLESARAYSDLVHQPLRQLRGGVRQARRGDLAAGSYNALSGSVQLLLRWPYYLIRWRSEVARHVVEPSPEACPS